MRLAFLDSGHSNGAKAFFALIRTMSRRPVLDVIKLVTYRSDLYGGPMQGATHEAMRGPSGWSIADRELMAAFVAKTNQPSSAQRPTPRLRNRHMATGKRSPCCCPIPTLRLSISRCGRRCSCLAS